MMKNTALTSALRRKNARLIQFKLRRRAIQCSSTRQPTMMNQPMANAMRNPAQQSERQQQSAHDHVREKRRRQRVLRPPRHHERMQPVRFVELVILQRVNDVEADEPQHDGQRERGHLQNFQQRNIRAFHRQPRADGRERQRDAEKNVRVIREPLRERIKTNHHERHRRKVKAQRIQKITGGNQPRRRQNAEQNRARQRNLSRSANAGWPCADSARRICGRQSG